MKIKTINQIKFDENIILTECVDGFWLYDETRGMNLSMKCKSESAALFEALQYYKNRSIEYENNLNLLRTKVLGFVELFVHDVDYGSSSDIPDTVLEINI